MFRILFVIMLLLTNLKCYSQSCTSTVYFDNMETFTWFGDWWTPALTTGFFTNASVSTNLSATIYGSGTGTSTVEQDWYSLPNITGLNPAYQYQLKFRLASYTFSNSTATTRGLDVADYLSVQISTNGGISYVNELRITGNSNATWPFTATGTITHTANGSFTNAAAPLGDVYQAPVGSSTTGPSTIILNLQPNISQVAVDLYCRVNSAGEEFWIDNVELIEIIPTPNLAIVGESTVCSGEPVTLTAIGDGNISWSNGITNGVSFIPSITANYTATATLNGMINGNGTFNTCTNTSNRVVSVDPNCILPIYLSYFDGYNSDKINHLNWKVEQQVNGSHFEIEKSKDGINFQKIGTILIDDVWYNFIDDNPFIGENYYRLKMIDLDGSWEYSNTIVVDLNYDSEHQIFPNPFNDRITYNSKYEDKVEVTIYELNGKILYSEIHESQFNRTIYVGNLNPGAYFIRVKHLENGLQIVEKIFKI